MSKYIVNLTDSLIAKNRYHEIWKRFEALGREDMFIGHVKLDLESNDICEMNSETLGRIMCSFEVGDVMASKSDLFDEVMFAGNCGGMLRELVAVCLAHAIRGRLDCRLTTKLCKYMSRSVERDVPFMRPEQIQAHLEEQERNRREHGAFLEQGDHGTHRSDEAIQEEDEKWRR